MLVAAGRRAGACPARRPGAAGACWGRCSVGQFWAPLSGIADSRPLGVVVSWLVLGAEFCKDSRL